MLARRIAVALGTALIFPLILSRSWAVPTVNDYRSETERYDDEECGRTSLAAGPAARLRKGHRFAFVSPS